MTITTFPINTVLPTASIITSTASGAVTATDVQTAINQLAGLVVPYTEGTWTPGIAFGGGTTGLTYTSRAGAYVKIGKMVHIQGTIVVNSNGSSVGAATLTGLPFTAHATIGCLMGAYVDGSTGDSLYSFGEMNPNTTTVNLMLDFGGDAPWDDTTLLDGTTIRIGGTYISTT